MAWFNYPPRRMMMAAAVLLLCVVGVSAAPTASGSKIVATELYTPAQHLATRTLLQSIAAMSPAMIANWAGAEFCGTCAQLNCYDLGVFCGCSFMGWCGIICNPP